MLRDKRPDFLARRVRLYCTPHMPCLLLYQEKRMAYQAYQETRLPGIEGIASAT